MKGKKYCLEGAMDGRSWEDALSVGRAALLRQANAFIAATGRPNRRAGAGGLFADMLKVAIMPVSGA